MEWGQSSVRSQGCCSRLHDFPECHNPCSCWGGKLAPFPTAETQHQWSGFYSWQKMPCSAQGPFVLNHTHDKDSSPCPGCFVPSPSSESPKGWRCCWSLQESTTGSANKATTQAPNLIWTQQRKNIFLAAHKGWHELPEPRDNEQHRGCSTMSKGLLSCEIPLVSSRQQQKGKGEQKQQNNLGCLNSSRNLSISLRKGIHLHQQFPFVWIPVCCPPHPPFTLPTFSPGSQLGNLLCIPSPDIPAQTPGTSASQAP